MICLEQSNLIDYFCGKCKVLITSWMSRNSVKLQKNVATNYDGQAHSKAVSRLRVQLIITRLRYPSHVYGFVPDDTKAVT